jgi:hypothetical protein
MTSEHIQPSVEGAVTRPTLGFWLGFLTVGLCLGSIRMALETFQQISLAQEQVPELLEMGAWQTYKVISAILCLVVFAAAILGVHAIHSGKTRGHLLRVVAVIWFMSLGSSVIDFLASGFLFGFAATAESFADQAIMIQVVISIVVACLWTAYLLRSDRCRLRYP